MKQINNNIDINLLIKDFDILINKIFDNFFNYHLFLRQFFNRRSFLIKEFLDLIYFKKQKISNLVSFDIVDSFLVKLFFKNKKDKKNILKQIDLYINKYSLNIFLNAGLKNNYIEIVFKDLTYNDEQLFLKKYKLVAENYKKYIRVERNKFFKNKNISRSDKNFKLIEGRINNIVRKYDNKIISTYLSLFKF